MYYSSIVVCDSDAYIAFCATVHVVLQVLQFEQQYLDALPSAQMYEKSYMHRDTLTYVVVSNSLTECISHLALIITAPTTPTTAVMQCHRTGHGLSAEAVPSYTAVVSPSPWFGCKHDSSSRDANGISIIGVLPRCMAQGTKWLLDMQPSQCQQ